MEPFDPIYNFNLQFGKQSILGMMMLSASEPGDAHKFTSSSQAHCVWDEMAWVCGDINS